MKIEKIVSPFMGENIYVYYDENTLEAVIIDPGSGFDLIKIFIEENELKVKAILLTHGHIDHIGAARELKEFFSVKIYASKKELPIITDAEKNFSLSISENKEALVITPDELFEDGDDFKLAENTIKVILTPGHTPGGICFYDETAKVLFAGDTLFCRSVGRWDFYGGNREALMESISKKLYALADDIIVYPGHGSLTILGDEKKENPFVTVSKGAG